MPTSAEFEDKMRETKVSAKLKEAVLRYSWQDSRTYSTYTQIIFLPSLVPNIIGLTCKLQFIMMCQGSLATQSSHKFQL